MGWSIGLIAIGVLSIVVFILIPPFNDWSWQPDSSLFSDYGEFIGGFVGALFSLAGFILLYLTLRSQQKSIEQQKRTSEVESFESTFFNLLNIQQGITNDIIVHFSSLVDIADVRSYTVKGRESFRFAVSQMFRINNSLSSVRYMGIYDEKEAKDWEAYLYSLWEDPFQNESDPDHDVEKKGRETIKNMRLQLTNKLFNISQGKWSKGNSTEGVDRLKFIYQIFFERFDYAYGYYFRNLYHILKYVDQFEQLQINRKENDSDEVSQKCNQYAQFIQAQMSSYELAVLYYNVLCFPRALTLIKKYKFDEHMPNKYLIGNHKFI